MIINEQKNESCSGARNMTICHMRKVANFKPSLEIREIAMKTEWLRCEIAMKTKWLRCQSLKMGLCVGVTMVPYPLWIV